MSSTKAPAFQFYVRDWLTDSALTRCGPATRGIWMDMLATMWLAPTRGVLSGMTVADLARACRATVAEMEDALVELAESGAADALLSVTNGVTQNVTRNALSQNRDAKVTVKNRRMWRLDKGRSLNAQRQLRFRERKRAEAEGGSNGRSNAEVTPPSASASASAIERLPVTPRKKAPGNASVEPLEALSGQPSEPEKPPLIVRTPDQPGDTIGDLIAYAAELFQGMTGQPMLRGARAMWAKVLREMLDDGVLPASLKTWVYNWFHEYRDDRSPMKFRWAVGDGRDDVLGYCPPPRTAADQAAWDEGLAEKARGEARLDDYQASQAAAKARVKEDRC